MTAKAAGALPTFLVIGAQKAGTTSLHAYLAGHPDVFVAAKELNFFTDLEFHRGLDWYAAQFAGAGTKTARGDVSPLYTAHPWLAGVPERVARHLPGVKLVYLLRNPIERTLSNYRYHVALGIESLPIEEALFAGNPAQYLLRSMYAQQIDQWRPHIDTADLLCVTSEDLRANRDSVLGRVFGHIGVDRQPPAAATDRELNRTEDLRQERPGWARLKQTPAGALARVSVPAAARSWLHQVVGSRPAPAPAAGISPELRVRLLDFFRPDLERLRGYVGPDFDCWGLLDPP